MQITGVPNGMVPRVGACQGSQILKTGLQKSHPDTVLGWGGGSQRSEEGEQDGTSRVMGLDVLFAFAPKKAWKKQGLPISIGSRPDVRPRTNYFHYIMLSKAAKGGSKSA